MKRLALALTLGCSSPPTPIGPPPPVDAGADAQITLPISEITIVRGESSSFVATIDFAEGAQPGVLDLPEGVTASETIVHQSTSTITFSATPDAPMASVLVNVMVGVIVAKLQLNVASADGSLDLAIGKDGIVSVGGPVAGTAASPDGSIFAVVATELPNAFRIARLTASGALDAAFGNGGLVDVTIDNAPSVTIRSLTVAPDGRAVIAYSASPQQGLFFADAAGNISRVDIGNPSGVAPFQGGFLVSGSAGGVGFIDASNVVTLVASKPAHPLGPILPWSDGSIFVGGRVVSAVVTKLAPQSFAIDTSFAKNGELLLAAHEVDALVPDFAGTGVVVAEGPIVMHMDTNGNVLGDLVSANTWSQTTALVPLPVSQTFLLVGKTQYSGGDSIMLTRIDGAGATVSSFGLFGTTTFIRTHDLLGDPNMPVASAAFSGNHLWVASDDGVRAYRAAP